MAAEGHMESGTGAHFPGRCVCFPAGLGNLPAESPQEAREG
jgi:hypothetical protein